MDFDTIKMYIIMFFPSIFSLIYPIFTINSVRNKKIEYVDRTLMISGKIVKSKSTMYLLITDLLCATYNITMFWIVIQCIIHSSEVECGYLWLFFFAILFGAPICMFSSVFNMLSQRNYNLIKKVKLEITKTQKILYIIGKIIMFIPYITLTIILTIMLIWRFY